MTLKERIKNKGLKVNWVASQIGVNQVTMYAYLSGDRNMPQSVSDDIKKLID